jgi:hypothetical protein
MTGKTPNLRVRVRLDSFFTQALLRSDGSPKHCRRTVPVASLSQFDPNVWSGRASQEVLSVWRLCGLASMYSASRWSVTCSGPPWISARADRPRAGHSGHQRSHAPGRPIPHLVSSSRRLGGKRLWDYVIAGSLSVQGWPSRLARLWRRVSRPCLDDSEHGTTLNGSGRHLACLDAF